MNVRLHVVITIYNFTFKIIVITVITIYVLIHAISHNLFQLLIEQFHLMPITVLKNANNIILLNNRLQQN